MASLSMQSCGTRNHHHSLFFADDDFQNRRFFADRFTPVSKLRSPMFSNRITCRSMEIVKPELESTTSHALRFEKPYFLKNNRDFDRNRVCDDGDRLDKWMRDSVVEIVKNLREVPMFVLVYNDGTSLKTETAASPEDWAVVSRRWEEGEAAAPDGIILVEELKDIKVIREEDEGQIWERENKVTKAWGVVVQGKGGESGAPACYLLKTSRVRSSLGLGCTHFCLVKAKSFRETAHSQLLNSWLVQSR